MLIDLIAGARPNFMKIAPILAQIKIAQRKGENINYRFVHTGQHYDNNMSGQFMKELDIPNPDINLESGGGTHAEQTGKIMVGYEKLLMKKPSEYALVVGDVNSTLACSIVAKKMGVKVIHVESGIRSGDISMPEEVNRIVTDSITDYFFTTSVTANRNLVKSGVSSDKIFFVGNTMIDTLLKNKHKFKKPMIWDDFLLNKNQYIILTLHRPSNVDDSKKLSLLLKLIIKACRNLKVVFPLHPRTKKL